MTVCANYIAFHHLIYYSLPRYTAKTRQIKSFGAAYVIKIQSLGRFFIPAILTTNV